jgi:hypothetical protein
LSFTSYKKKSVEESNEVEDPVPDPLLIPQVVFWTASTEPQTPLDIGTLIKNSLFNLCPLPSRDNVKKTNKKLKLIEDEWLIQQIEKYSNISRSEFSLYYEVENYTHLRTKRRAFFEEKFVEKKKLIIS